MKTLITILCLMAIPAIAGELTIDLRPNATTPILTLDRYVRIQGTNYVHIAVTNAPIIKREISVESPKIVLSGTNVLWFLTFGGIERYQGAVIVKDKVTIRK